MKKLIIIFYFLPCISSIAQPGYEIRVTLKPYRDVYIYLGHYFGKQYPIIDSAKLDANNTAVFKGDKKLPGGIYLIGFPNRSGFFEVLVDKQQHFSIIADTASIKNGVKFINSPDNVLFNSYQQYMSVKGKEIAVARQQYSNAKNASDSAHWNDELNKTDKIIREYRENIIKKNPGSILSSLLITMREPEMPKNLQHPANKEDSLNAYNYYKGHYWDGVNFWDGRLAYTTFFEDKLDKYFTQLVVPHPDSVNKEIDRMLGYASINEEMNQFLLLKFVNRYLVQRYMWEDAVMVHLFEKYFASKNYAWLTDKGRKTITDRAYSLMANIMGTPASDIELPDTAGKMVSLYAQPASYTIVCIWDPTCSHCKEVLPKLDSFYQSKWKAAGLRVYAVAKETDGSKNDWFSFINDHHLQEWTNVYYSKADDKVRVDAGIPSYSQLYDVQTFPTLYLLDKDKRIVAKKLSYEQIDEVLQLKMKGM